ncbi:hemagglutinin repeat-containing protein [Pseudomonas oryzihabitans]|uniref:hemagglutinin repeat-containing protein n=1 Tax=Pseudomonas oryzihabitans TaxID=47885 RepID=UPI003F59491A
MNAQTQNGHSRGANNTSSSSTQLTGSLAAGRGLSIVAERDLTATATTLTAGGNATLTAQDNLTINLPVNRSLSPITPRLSIQAPANRPPGTASSVRPR